MIFARRIEDKSVLKIVEGAREYIPVNVKKLAENLGITVSEADDLDQEGYISIEQDKPIIVVNKKDPETQKRFTIAHEIAHYLIHRDELFHRGSLDRDDNPLSAYIDKKEMEADALGADILMPRDKITALIEYGGVDSISDLAECLQVSEEVLKIQLKVLRTS